MWSLSMMAVNGDMNANLPPVSSTRAESTASQDTYLIPASSIAKGTLELTAQPATTAVAGRAGYASKV
jgi:hypothetical protein